MKTTGIEKHTNQNSPICGLTEEHITGEKTNFAPDLRTLGAMDVRLRSVTYASLRLLTQLKTLS